MKKAAAKLSTMMNFMNLLDFVTDHETVWMNFEDGHSSKNTAVQRDKKTSVPKGLVYTK